MPSRTLRYCTTCLATQHAFARDACPACGTPLLPLLDENGALSRGFLAARGTCCGSGCRNCPYSPEHSKSDCLAGGARSKTCGRCGTSFDCHRGECWCDAERLSEATLKLLRRTYADCLCPACLREFAQA